MNNIEKRKKNRIQGGWGKSVTKTKIEEKKDSDDDIIFTDGVTVPKFDKNATSELVKLCEFIEIKDDGVYKLNHKDIPDEVVPARIEFMRNYISSDESESLYLYFLTNLPWEQRHNATITGEEYMEPRETCWYGLPYSYSRINMSPNDNWDPKLKKLCKRLQGFAEPNKPFNSVMCNLYRNAKHSIDWHADDEKSLGDKPMIASISLGSTRVFNLCKRSDLYTHYKSQSRNPYRSRNKEEPPFDECSILYNVFLNSGSLLTMSGSMQEFWLHRVPKEYHDHSPRINFTFRHIIPGYDKSSQP